MDFRKHWQEIGGSFDTVCGNMGSERMVLKFAKKYGQDQTCQRLQDAVQAGNLQEAFLQAHTLKGIALNLGFGDLARDASALTEKLRAGSLDQELYETVCADQAKVLAFLSKLP